MRAARHLIGGADTVKIDVMTVAADFLLQLGKHFVGIEGHRLGQILFLLVLHNCFPQLDRRARIISVFSRSAFPSILAALAPYSPPSGETSSPTSCSTARHRQ